MLEIIDYRPEWPGEFARYADMLQAALGGLALSVDHIGSTAVPGLAAKDVIDIQVSVADLSNEVADAIRQAGFRLHSRIVHDHIPPGHDADPAQWSKMLFKEPLGGRRSHIHVRRHGHANQRYPLLFRDFLIASPAMAQAYAETKRRLAANLADPSTYPEVKDPIVDLVYLAALDWAKRTGWNPA